MNVTLNIIEGDHPNEMASQGNSNSDKIDRNRARNKEHAKKTRIRKKEMIENLKVKLADLQQESSRLELLLEESKTANILLCMGAGSNQTASVSKNCEVRVTKPTLDFIYNSSSDSNHEGSDQDEGSLHEGGMLLDCKDNLVEVIRKTVRKEISTVHHNSDPSETSNKRKWSDLDQMDSHSDSHHNEHSLGVKTWKNGNSIDENSSDPNSSKFEDSISKEIPEEFSDPTVIRRERNRLHAKLTRDRKKLFTERMLQTIHALELHNQQLRSTIESIRRASV